MRNWKVAAALTGLILAGVAPDTSAQYRRSREYQDRYEGSQYGQYGGGQNYDGQGYSRGQQFQQAGQANGGQRYVARRMSGQSQGGAADRELASWLLVDNRGEIQLAHLAAERASCDDVKQLAKKLIDDHAKMVEELQQFAGQGRNSSQSGGLNLVRLKQQLGQQCVASAEQELESKDGDEFDKCFIGLQIAKHMEMLDTLKVFSRYASPELDELIEEAEQTTKDHLKHAKQLIKQLDEDNDNGSSRSSSRSSSRDDSSSDRSSGSRENRRSRSSNEEG
ncbi:MAG TPA: DUF4142 domain-containing protein [Pirellulales bacterium]|nr:DUF4142 domain-containing protein [Pirellulales bacterium]